ncbi:unnamed protein product [Acanthosepion pharaonis]|uniref:Uncharacterized protein n=1 Tax=Acanthosepion pharaonis TaxID=158019 RepID=A0A812DH22_ACAPH|nr:unnamed protein product [Sepia pharaonis]
MSASLHPVASVRLAGWQRFPRLPSVRPGGRSSRRRVRPYLCLRRTRSGGITRQWSISARGWEEQEPSPLRRLLAREFRAAGLSTGPCELCLYALGSPLGLDILETDDTRSVRDVAYFVRSKPTGSAGVEGLGLWDLQSARARAHAGLCQGKHPRFNARLPQKTLHDIVRPHFIHLRMNAKRRTRRSLSSTMDDAVLQMDELAARGATLFVGEDQVIGRSAAKASGRTARFTLDAQWIDGVVRRSPPCYIRRNRRDRNRRQPYGRREFHRENGAIAMLQLARHFASLPVGQRLRRTLVFGAWPGHMKQITPGSTGWARAHPELMRWAAAGIHDRAFGRVNGPISRARVEAAPGRPTRVFHESGILMIACIAGPNYLLVWRRTVTWTSSTLGSHRAKPR